MYKRISLFAVLLGMQVLLFAGTPPQVFVSDSALRVDYLLTGTDTTAEVLFGQIKKEPAYGGSPEKLTSGPDYGTYRYRLYERSTGKLIFSRGFCPLFQEWQTTGEAKKMKRSFYQVARLPYPRVQVKFTVEQRKKDGSFGTIASLDIDPDDYFILNEVPSSGQVVQILQNGPPSARVDIVFLPEGYRQEEMDKFIGDVNRMAGYLFAADPFSQRKQDFNLYAVKVPSVESGTDVPGERIYRNTAFNSTFYTFDIARYLTSSDMKSIHDAASAVPFDHIVLLVNSDRYGGGGFYNFLTVTTAGHSLTPQVLVHEFGHAFAGLADEYYTSDVAYEEYYRLDVEPWEPNITTLVEFDRKWKSMLHKKTPVPTPRNESFAHTLGVFEGGGYVAKGIYSPMMDCRMKSNAAPGFCPVCKQAILEAIDRHCR